VRYTGPGRSPWQMIAVVAIVIVAIAALYLLILQPR
jgi:uncharacterized protein involved in exopolysaccharide biosynthesis